MTGIVRARAGVRFDRIGPAGFRILSAIDQAAQALQLDLTITSGTDSHGETDPHYSGDAYDLAALGMTAQQIVLLHGAFRRILGPLFTVLYEVPHAPADALLASMAYVNPKATGPHFHVQRLKGTTFPPETKVA